MVRATSSVASRRSRKRMLKLASGYWGDRKNHLRLSSDAVVRAMANSYRHRKMKKRDFRSLWISRLSVASKIHGISYSKFINGLKRAQCLLNRKMLADMALRDPKAFAGVIEKAKSALIA